MEQIEQLFELLKQTPEMALYGITIYFLFILLKLASWVYALQRIMSLGINRLSEYKNSKIVLDKDKIEAEIAKTNSELFLREEELVLSKLKFDNSAASRISKQFRKDTISTVEETNLLLLIEEMKSSVYIHQNDIINTLKILRDYKNKNK